MHTNTEFKIYGANKDVRSSFSNMDEVNKYIKSKKLFPAHNTRCIWVDEVTTIRHELNIAVPTLSDNYKTEIIQILNNVTQKTLNTDTYVPDLIFLCYLSNRPFDKIMLDIVIDMFKISDDVLNQAKIEVGDNNSTGYFSHSYKTKNQKIIHINNLIEKNRYEIVFKYYQKLLELYNTNPEYFTFLLINTNYAICLELKYPHNGDHYRKNIMIRSNDIVLTTHDYGYDKRLTINNVANLNDKTYLDFKKKFLK